MESYFNDYLYEQVVVGVPAIYLAYVQSIVPSSIEVAAQNCWKVAKGAFTGKEFTTLILIIIPDF